MAEVIKYGLIGDTVLLSLLEVGARPDASKAWPEALELLEIVERCALAKRRLVLSDERDTDGVQDGTQPRAHGQQCVWKQQLGIGSATVRRLPMAFAPLSTSACPWASRRPRRRTARRG